LTIFRRLAGWVDDERRIGTFRFVRICGSGGPDCGVGWLGEGRADVGVVGDGVWGWVQCDRDFVFDPDDGWCDVRMGKQWGFRNDYVLGGRGWIEWFGDFVVWRWVRDARDAGIAGFQQAGGVGDAGPGADGGDPAVVGWGAVRRFLSAAR